jgi:ABC-type phosphonate transport system ATPase subunit
VTRALDDFDDVPLAMAVRRALRVARRRGDTTDAWWLMMDSRPAGGSDVIRSPIVLRTLRKAVYDVEVSGVVIPTGTLVGANMAAANRDPAVYDDPDRFDITRRGPAPMLISEVASTTAWA